MILWKYFIAFCFSTLIWRNFCKKNHGGKFSNYHYHTVLHKLVEVMVTSNSDCHYKDWFHVKCEGENNFQTSKLWGCVLISFQKNEESSLTEKNSSNQLFSNFFVRQLLSRNFCEKVWERISAFSTAQCGKTKNSVSPKFFSSNLLFSDFFGKNVTFTKFLPKMCETKSQQFPHCTLTTQCGKTKHFILAGKISRQINYLVISVTKISWK